MLNAVADNDYKNHNSIGQIGKNSRMWVTKIPKEINFKDEQVQS